MWSTSGCRSHEAVGDASARRDGFQPHVLIVTPVIFFWLRERELKREQGRSHKAVAVIVAPIVIAALLLPSATVSAHTPLQTETAQTNAVIALSRSNKWHDGRPSCDLRLGAQWRARSRAQRARFREGNGQTGTTACEPET